MHWIEIGSKMQCVSQRRAPGERETHSPADGAHADLPEAQHQQSAKGHKTYPYLLRGLRVTQPNQVWAADITYLPMRRGFLYLVAIMDWHTRRVHA